jgi:hypothetical protein
MTTIPSVLTLTTKIKMMIQVPALATMVAVGIAGAAVEVAIEEVISLAVSERKVNFKAG